jgi:hypothetical protein
MKDCKKGNRAQNKKSSIEEFLLEEIAESERISKKLSEETNKFFWGYVMDCYDAGIEPDWECEPTEEDIIAQELAW